MEILQIDVGGKMAHFRKYYANNTALTFTLPPRTAIIGMLAAILGIPRDEYYKKFSSDRIRIAISVRSPVKKTFHRLNFLSIKSLGDIKGDLVKGREFTSDFRGMGGRIQTPFEIVTGNNIIEDELSYRIFVSYFEEGKDTFKELQEKVLDRRIHYSLCFGIASFSAFISQAILYEKESIVEKEALKKELQFDSAVISEKVNALNFEENDLSFVEEELMPADFTDDYNRELSAMNRVLFCHAGRSLKITYSGKYYTIGDEQCISFLENG